MVLSNSRFAAITPAPIRAINVAVLGDTTETSTALLMVAASARLFIPLYLSGQGGEKHLQNLAAPLIDLDGKM
jgi:hypothetical protein